MDKQRDPKKVASRFEELQREIDFPRLETYASYTLPSVMPPENSKGRELQASVDSTGAQAVNHLSNKLILTLFRPNQPFYRLEVADEDIVEINKLATAGDPDSIAVLQALDDELTAKENSALLELDYNKYRTESTMAANHLIITGNALMYHPEDGGKVQTYGLRDYAVQRDLSGTLTELITRDKKALETFSQDIQDQIKASKRNTSEKGSDKDVCLYTHVKLNDKGKYELKQYADDIELDSEGLWAPEDLPWIPLTWKRIRGENYGRGLVEDYAGAFHALTVLTNSLIDLAAIAADIKWLVRPSSVLDVEKLNNSKSGSYHQGEEGDIVAAQLNKLQDMQIVMNAIERYTIQISKAFLLNSAATRDAERVTAEEIRFIANELEMSYGGIYSRFAEEWQLPVARLTLRRVGLKIGKGRTIYPRIITGLESLTRSGDMENIHLMFADLAAAASIPEVFQQEFDAQAFIKFAAKRRGVEYSQFLKSMETKAAEQQAMQQQQQQMMQAQAQANVSEEAGKQAVQQEN